MTNHGQRAVGMIARVIAMACLVIAVGIALPAELLAFTLNVEGCDANNVCTAYTGNFRWLIEEDNTTQSPPGVRVPDSIGLVTHNSHAPVVSSGSGTAGTADVAVDPLGRYYVSVLPDPGYSIGGAMVAAGQGSVTVRVNQQAIPTAQVSVLVFKDHSPINNIFDAGEAPITGANILIFDAGGQMTMDAFGNPLGTTYDAVGNVLAMGTGIIQTDANGVAYIKNLVPGKYGIRAVPPGDPATYVQTSTIEGTPGIDAWVKANEPPQFIEGFGTGFHHAFIGFVMPAELPWAAGGPGANTISGQNVFNHFGRPPLNQGFVPGPPVAECWIGLNDIASATGLMAVPCDASSNFSLSGIPDGTYQMVTWDKPLDALFGFNTVTVAGASVNLGQVLSFRWFGTLEGSVFYDANQNGFRDAGEPGIMEQNINIRFRDGSIYQAQPTDAAGEFGFSEVFPFFKWLVTEVDFARYKATGMTAAVDYGGVIPPANGWIVPSFDALNPQPQASVNPNTGNNLSRTETGPVLTQAMQLYLNQTNVIDWGKAAYAPGENGGISGIVFYDTTRAENDPRYNGGEPWQPGIPRVQVCLYQDNLTNATGLPGPDGIIDDINGTPGIQLCDVDNAPFGDFPGPGDVERSGTVGVLDLGDAIDMATTDSFDDNKPTGCVQDLPPIVGVQPCYDNYGTWNQVRPGLFDGGYAFGPNLPNGTYIVEALPPTGYQVVKEEDKNVDFGDEYRVSGLLLPPVCTGTVDNGMPQHIVPASLALFPGVAIDPPLAGSTTPLCNMKQIAVADGKNAATDFFFFTEVPKAARIVGFSNNDLAAEFNAGSPIFGEKTSPAWLPVSLQDWQGNEVARVYMDEWGSYNALLPSSYTMNVPIPSGVSPNMITAVLNHPFLPNGQQDPFYDPRYSVTPWTLDYWPGKTTYVDTPLVPIASFTGFPQNGPDVNPVAGTPVISSVYTATSPSGPVTCSMPDTVTLTSLGTVMVPNPDFDPAVPGSQPQVARDYGFGTAGTVFVNGTAVDAGSILSWSDSTISFTLDGVVPGSYQLSVTRADSGLSSPRGVTLQVLASCATGVRYVSPGPGAIQAAVDAAADGDLIVVAPGTYPENVILYKNVKLQGSGAGSTTIFATPLPADRLAAWHAKVLAVNGADPFLANEAPGILVLGSVPGFANGPDLIDGFTIMGTIAGGGITVDNNAGGIVISNNLITGNQGTFGGGITVGAPDRVSNNPGVVITKNDIIGNGGVQGGGGIALYAGSDNYVVRDNSIGKNFSRFNGGGIAHVGLSSGGLIENNRIIFNEVAFGGAAFSNGAGIYIGGDQPLGALGAGTGSVTINANLIQGNLAGVGSGAGIQATAVNGQDVLAAPGNPNAWYQLMITNNMIVNNVAGYTGGGIALQDVARAAIANNTIANNDSTATAAMAFAAGATDSTPQAAGIVSNLHSALLTAATGTTQTFSDPVLTNNIIWSNRSFYTTNGGAGGLVPNPQGIVWDLDVLGSAVQLNPDHSILTNLTPAHGGNYSGNGNLSGNPQFVTSYVNTIVTAAVIDEGGNFITVRFTPLTVGSGDYHITTASPAINLADAATAPVNDYDGDARAVADIGADEVPAGDAVPYGSVTINGGAVATRLRNVTLTINASSTVSTITNMRLSWNNVSWTAWETYAPTRSATIPAGADGIKTIYIQFRDATSAVSPVYSDSIILDTTGPTGSIAINNGAEATSNRAVALTIAATDTMGTVTNMRLSWNNVNWTAWETYATTRNALIPIGADGSKTIYIQFRDALGNMSTTYSDSIMLDRAGPTGSVTINGGAATTNTRAVALTLSATDTLSTVTNMRFSWNGTNWYGWETYATSRNATIPGTTAGTYTVYTQFRDAAGNISAPFSDAIDYAP